jgi:outer membrane protein assembly factor BamB
LDASNGKVIWRKDPFPGVTPRFFTAYSPIIVDRMAIVHVGGPGNGAIIAFDLASGNEKWRWGGEGPDYGSPVLFTAGGVKQIATPTEQSIVGIGVADGKLLWKFPFPPARRSYNAATPIVGEGVIIVTGAGRATKDLKIEKQGDGFTATEQWSNPDLATQFNTPVLRGDLLFGLSDRNNLFCINAQTGKTAWADSTSNGSRGFGSIVGAGSCLIGLSNGSELVVFKPDGNAYSEIKRYKVSDSEIYAHPVVAGNRIFIKDQETLTLWTL